MFLDRIVNDSLPVRGGQPTIYFKGVEYTIDEVNNLDCGYDRLLLDLEYEGTAD